MPKLVFLHHPGQISLPEDAGGRDIGWTKRTLDSFGRLLRPLVAEACSTPEHPLDGSHVDWVPQAYQPGTVALTCMELWTIGYEDRVQQLTRERLLELKEAIIAIANAAEFVPILEDRKFFHIPVDEPFLWPIYVDPRGHHV